MITFVPRKNEDTLEVAEAMPIRSKDPIMRIKKNVRVPTVQLEQPDEEEENKEEILITRSRSAKKKKQPSLTQRESTLHHPQRKQRLGEPEINEVPKRKRKLLSVASFAAKKAKLHFELLSYLENKLGYKLLQSFRANFNYSLVFSCRSLEREPLVPEIQQPLPSLTWRRMWGPSWQRKLCLALKKINLPHDVYGCAGPSGTQGGNRWIPCDRGGGGRLKFYANECDDTDGKEQTEASPRSWLSIK